MRQDVEKFLRDKLRTHTEALTEPQRDLFNRIFPRGVPVEKIEDALALCERTAAKHASSAPTAPAPAQQATKEEE